MTRLAISAGILAFALLTFFVFPGHTWLQQDSQIYVPILEHLRDPTVLQNDILAQRPHVDFTIYDEVSRLLRAISGQGDFRGVLAFQQIVTRALGIWGLYLMASALGLATGPALLAAGVCSLGALIAGPQVLTLEYEPTPRAFAVPLLLCAAGNAAKLRYVAAGWTAAVAFLYHPPTVLPFLAVFVVIVIARREWSALWPLAAAVAVLLAAAWAQAGPGERQTFFTRLTPLQEQLQRMRAAYAWISTWPAERILGHVAIFAVAAAAFARIRQQAGLELRVFLLGLPLLGVLSMPLSWLLLDHWRWALIPQIQPMRTLLFGTLFMQLLASVAAAHAVKAGRLAEGLVWLAAALYPPAAGQWRGLLVALAAAVAAVALLRYRPAFAPAAALTALFAFPTMGAVVNYPRLHTPELAQLSAWARASTPRDAVFAFPDAGHSLDPGIFRAESLRAVYVDWKGGGQVNYLKEFAAQWWFRWQQVMSGKAQPPYDALGISYVVLKPGDRLPRAAVFENTKYVVYGVVRF